MLLHWGLLARGGTSVRLITPVANVLTNASNLLLKDIAKTDQGILRDMLRAHLASVLVADPTPARNDRKLSPSVLNKHVPYMLIQLLQVSPVRSLSVCG